MKKLKADAVLTINNAGEMSDTGRAILAKWLRDQSKFLLKHGTELAPRFRARRLHEV